nr:hypothetical protein BDOA9_0154430 [Bradyrhizobium sp. DOA9]
MLVAAVVVGIGLSRNIVTRGAFALCKGIVIGHRDLPPRFRRNHPARAPESPPAAPQAVAGLTPPSTPRTASSTGN